MLKKIIITILVLAAIAGGAIYVYRYQIIQSAAEKFIRAILPGYIKIEKIDLDMPRSKIILSKFEIMNPPGFSSRDLIEAGEISCSFRMKGMSFMNGIEILSPVLTGVVLNIERLSDGTTNLEAMAKYTGPASTGKASGAKDSPGATSVSGKKNLSDALKIPETFIVKKSKVVFTDHQPYPEPYIITLADIDAALTLKLDSSYTNVLRVGTAGTGSLNGNIDQAINWNLILDLTTPKLTMSNRIEVSNADILTFEPYYDKLSPFVFKVGRFSGSIVVDFDNGNIGSTNVIRLKKFIFYIKRGSESAAFWETSVQDLAKYFTSSFDEVVFDFKIKGDMAKPDYFLGPISKQAVASMAIDKISSVIGNIGDGTVDMGKAKEYIDLFKELIKKK